MRTHSLSARTLAALDARLGSEEEWISTLEISRLVARQDERYLRKRRRLCRYLRRLHVHLPELPNGVYYMQTRLYPLLWLLRLTGRAQHRRHRPHSSGARLLSASHQWRAAG